jgi:phospholipid-binding lipoprotein MlaA
MPKEFCGKTPRRARTLPVLLIALSLLATGCASQRAAEEAGETYDPLESINRPIFGFNMFLDRWLLRPVAKGYDTVAPKGVKFAVTNFFWNLEQPTYIVNHLLQGKPLPALRQTGRFVINSTLGLGGIIDAAKDASLPREPEDFGQTLAVWGWKGGGPFIMAPLLGPSNPRDLIGWYADRYTDLRYYIDDQQLRYALLALKIIDTRRRLLPADSAIAEAPDQYIFVREAWLSKRRFDIYDGNPPAEIDDFEADFDAEFEAEFE